MTHAPLQHGPTERQLLYHLLECYNFLIPIFEYQSSAVTVYSYGKYYSTGQVCEADAYTGNIQSLPVANAF